MYPTICCFEIFSLYTNSEMKNIMMIPPAEIDGNKTAVGSKAVRTITSRFVAPLAIPANGAYMEHPFNCAYAAAKPMEYGTN